MTLELVDSEPVRLYSPGVARAMLRREAQARALADRLRALHRGSELEKRHAAGLAMRQALRIDAAAGGFNGRFTSIFPVAYQVVQCDIGVTLGTTPRASNAGGPVGTLSGTRALTRTFPLWFVCTTAGAVGSGAVYSAYVDGAGTVPFMAGITPSVGTPVALTGLGLSHAWAAGTSALNDSWKATCEQLNDQTAAGKHYTMGTVTNQPIVTIGINGKAGLVFLNNQLNSTLVLPSPNVTPWSGFLVYRRIGTGGGAFGRILADSTGNAGELLNYLTNAVQLYDTTFGPSSGTMPADTFGAVDFCFSNSANDYVRLGSSTAVFGAGAGGTTPSINRTIGGPSSPANIEVLALVYAPPQSARAFRAAATANYGSAVLV